MKNKYLTVLDFEVGEVFQYEINEMPVETANQDYEDYITEKGHRLNNIEWMVHDEPTIRRMYFTN